MNIAEIFNSIKNLPKTQQDISALAKASQQAQSPQFQKTIVDAQQAVTQYAQTQLALQAVSTVAIVGLFVLALTRR